MIEVEMKAKLANPAAMEQLLMSRGFIKAQYVSEQDAYFNGNNRDFRKTDEALRIRICEDIETGAKENTLTYKGSKLGSESQTRQEFEVAFENSANMLAILSALGFLHIFEVKKMRKSYTLGGITACIDHVDSLGDFLELEKLVESKEDYPEAVQELYAWLQRLEISKDSLTQLSYLELLMKK